MSRILNGALAGIGATIAMTVVMRQLHRRLPPASRYQLPPREIVQETLPPASEGVLRQLTTLSHFGYGAAAGAVFASLAPDRGAAVGMAYGTGVWAASYLGWIPAVGILRTAALHPRERNALMIAAHLVWGAVLALAARELHQAEESIFHGSPNAGSAPDAADHRKATPRSRRERTHAAGSPGEGSRIPACAISGRV